MSFDALQKAELLEQYMPQVYKIARQVGSRLTANVELDDLIQTGMIGLMDALQRYEEGESTFEAYAYHRIRGAIMDDLRDKDHLPRAVRQMQRQFDRMQQQLAHQLGRTPSDIEMAEAMQMELPQFHQAKSQFLQASLLSLNEYDDADDDQQSSSYLDRVAPASASLEEAMLEQQRKQELLQLIETLPEREQLILRLYFEQEMTFREIGGLMGVNESRVYQIHSAALNNLKNHATQTV